MPEAVLWLVASEMQVDASVTQLAADEILLPGFQMCEA
jgi:hypothetical protein